MPKVHTICTHQLVTPKPFFLVHAHPFSVPPPYPQVFCTILFVTHSAIFVCVFVHPFFNSFLCHLYVLTCCHSAAMKHHPCYSSARVISMVIISYIIQFSSHSKVPNVMCCRRNVEVGDW